tara:strand:- start:1220 stop:1810 length:591 start_codon:yes stop_codon:yes gene_type:complete
MYKKIITFSLSFYIAFFTSVKSAESGGMPQLNPEFWISQIFWLIITFSSLFIILSKFILPKISKNIEFRRSQILENIETADKQKKQSENKINEYEKLILESKNKARDYFNDARKKVLQDIEKKSEQLQMEINQELMDAEKEIVELKSKAPEKINKIAIETSSDLIKQLIGEDVNSSSISAIVDDLSKKSSGKYYDN